MVVNNRITTGIYMHNIVTINKQFHYFSMIYFKKRPRQRIGMFSLCVWIILLLSDGSVSQSFNLPSV